VIDNSTSFIACLFDVKLCQSAKSPLIIIKPRLRISNRLFCYADYCLGCKNVERFVAAQVSLDDECSDDFVSESRHFIVSDRDADLKASA
jgi:hypothetical protein